MEGTHQQVDVTPCSTKQEATESLKVVSLLYSSRRGRSAFDPNWSAVRVEGRTDTFKVCPPL